MPGSTSNIGTAIAGTAGRPDTGPRGGAGPARSALQNGPVRLLASAPGGPTHTPTAASSPESDDQMSSQAADYRGSPSVLHGRAARRSPRHQRLRRCWPRAFAFPSARRTYFAANVPVSGPFVPWRHITRLHCSRLSTVSIVSASSDGVGYFWGRPRKCFGMGIRWTWAG